MSKIKKIALLVLLIATGMGQVSGAHAQFPVADKWYLVFGTRHLHISNGNSKGVDRNPSHDSNGAD